MKKTNFDDGILKDTLSKYDYDINKKESLNNNANNEQHIYPHVLNHKHEFKRGKCTIDDCCATEDDWIEDLLMTP